MHRKQNSVFRDYSFLPFFYENPLVFCLIKYFKSLKSNLVFLIDKSGMDLGKKDKKRNTELDPFFLSKCMNSPNFDLRNAGQFKI